MVSCVVRNNAHRNENEVTQAFCRLQLDMKGEATEAQQFRLGCGSQQRTPSTVVCKQPKSEKNHTSHFRLHTSHFSFLTASFTLQTSHFTLHTTLFALQT